MKKKILHLLISIDQYYNFVHAEESNNMIFAILFFRENIMCRGTNLIFLGTILCESKNKTHTYIYNENKIGKIFEQ